MVAPNGTARNKHLLVAPKQRKMETHCRKMQYHGMNSRSAIWHQLRSNTSKWLLLLWIVFSIVGQVTSQVGSTICSCSPSVYEISLDFSRTCDDSGGFSQGVLLLDCSVIPFDGGVVTDFVPQIITLIDVSELGQNLQTVVGQNRFRGNFLSGETIQYSSVASDPFTIDETNIPKALQLSMIAVNSAGAELVLSALIVYSNSCTDYPVFLGGAGIGWAGLTQVREPALQLCPIAHSQPTTAPITPTFQPTRAPVIPTSLPTSAPVTPTFAPTGSPILTTSNPTNQAPTQLPSSVPSLIPTSANTWNETAVETPLPMTPTAKPTAGPTLRPTPRPTQSPTAFDPCEEFEHGKGKGGKGNEKYKKSKKGKDNKSKKSKKKKNDKKKSGKGTNVFEEHHETDEPFQDEGAEVHIVSEGGKGEKSSKKDKKSSKKAKDKKSKKSKETKEKNIASTRSNERSAYLQIYNDIFNRKSDSADSREKSKSQECKTQESSDDRWDDALEDGDESQYTVGSTEDTLEPWDGTYEPSIENSVPETASPTYISEEEPIVAGNSTNSTIVADNTMRGSAHSDNGEATNATSESFVANSSSSVNDSARGSDDRNQRSDPRNKPHSSPVDEMGEIESERSPVRTALIVGGSILALGFVGLLIYHHTFDRPPTTIKIPLYRNAI